MNPLDMLKLHVTGAIMRGETQAIEGMPAKRKQFNPFPYVSGKYGAPMGRHSDNPANLQDIKRLHAKHQGGGDGYDRGGAYWGTPSNIWAVWGHVGGEIVCCYVRAASRQAAINKIHNEGDN